MTSFDLQGPNSVHLSRSNRTDELYCCKLGRTLRLSGAISAVSSIDGTDNKLAILLQ